MVGRKKGVIERTRDGRERKGSAGGGVVAVGAEVGSRG